MLGINYGTGTTDAKRYNNVAGIAGALAYWSNDSATTTTYYFEDHFYLAPNFAFVGAGQFLTASLDRTAFYKAFRAATTTTFPAQGRLRLRDARRARRSSANVSRSGEIPTFSELTDFGSVVIGNLKAQTATTVEIGTRGRQPTYSWDVSLYRSWVQNELQCQDPGNTQASPARWSISAAPSIRGWSWASACRC